MRHVLISLFMPMSLLLVGCGGPSYDLQSEPQQGDIYRSVGSFSLRNASVKARVAGQETEVEGRAAMRYNQTTEIDMLEVDDGTPTRLKVSHLFGRSWFEMENSDEGTPPVDDVLLGRSVLFEAESNGWKPRLVGGEPTQEQAEAIQDYGEPWDDGFIPDYEVGPGDEWTIDGERLRQVFGFDEKGFTGKAKIHFEEVVDYNGEPCALLSIHIDVSGHYKGVGGPDTSMSLSGEGRTYHSLSDRIGVDTQIAGEADVRMNVVEEGQTIHLIMAGPFQLSEAVTKD